MRRTKLNFGLESGFGGNYAPTTYHVAARSALPCERRDKIEVIKVDVFPFANFPFFDKFKNDRKFNLSNKYFARKNMFIQVNILRKY